MQPFLFRYFISYWLNAVDEHSLHSPFFYDFYVKVIKKKPDEKTYRGIESLRRQLLNDRQAIETDDFTRENGRPGKRRISSIAARNLSPQKLSALYNRMIKHTNARTILELGTSLGINTLYLAEKKDATVHTFEGSSRMALIASSLFDSAGAKNIHLIEGNIDKTLPRFLSSSSKPDLVIMDVNTRYIPTIQYFRQLLPYVHTKSIVSIHGIHSSREMKKAWEEIKAHKLVYGSADLLRCGLVFFDPSLNKQNVVLQC